MLILHWTVIWGWFGHWLWWDELQYNCVMNYSFSGTIWIKMSLSVITLSNALLTVSWIISLTSTRAAHFGLKKQHLKIMSSCHDKDLDGLSIPLLEESPPTATPSQLGAHNPWSLMTRGRAPDALPCPGLLPGTQEHWDECAPTADLAASRETETEKTEFQYC